METFKIGLYIKELLKHQGKKQIDLALFLGVSKQVLSNTLRGANNLSVYRLLRISEFLDVPVESLINMNYKEKVHQKVYSRYEQVSSYYIVDYPTGYDISGKTVIDYLHEDQNIERFMYLLNNCLFPDDRNTRIKMLSFMLKNELFDLLKLINNYPNNDAKDNFLVEYNHLFPLVYYREDKQRYAVDTRVTTLTRYDIALQDYIKSVLKIRDTSIIDLVPDQNIKKVRRRSRRGKQITQTTRNYDKVKERDVYTPLIKCAIESDEVYIFEYFYKRYSFGYKNHYRELANAFNSNKILEFLDKTYGVE